MKPFSIKPGKVWFRPVQTEFWVKLDTLFNALLYFSDKLKSNKSYAPVSSSSDQFPEDINTFNLFSQHDTYVYFWGKYIIYSDDFRLKISFFLFSLKKVKKIFDWFGNHPYLFLLFFYTIVVRNFEINFCEYLDRLTFMFWKKMRLVSLNIWQIFKNIFNFTSVIQAHKCLEKDWGNWKPSRLLHSWIRLDTLKSPEDLRGLTFTQTSVKNHRLELVWKTC